MSITTHPTSAESIIAVVNGKWGFIDRFGNCVVPYSYDAANSFSDGLAHVLRGNTWGFVDRNGKWYASKDDYIPAFSDYAKRYVEQEINGLFTYDRKKKFSDESYEMIRKAIEEYKEEKVR